MELLSTIAKVDTAPSYTHVRCRRLGLSLEWFSRIRGRTIYCGDIHYESRKNFRSNSEFDAFKQANRISRRALVVMLDESIEEITKRFGDGDPAEFFNDAFDVSGVDYVVYATQNTNAKIRKSKVFYIKSTDVILVDLAEKRHLLVEKFTLEVSCNLQC